MKFNFQVNNNIVSGLQYTNTVWKTGVKDEKVVDTNAIGKREKARLREMKKLKKQKIQKIMMARNAAINADMNSKRKGHLKYLLQQTEKFSHFAKVDQSASQKKSRGRGRHALKLTEEEEDGLFGSETN